MGSVPKVAKADNRSTGRGPSTEHMRLSTPAKINWNLRVLERRADGFHEIESLFSAVSLVDELAFEIRSDTRITLHCTGLEVASDNSNLVMQAARLMAERSCCTRGVSCQLTKVIPVGGGLGGGSSDAAATLLALNKLWGLDWPRENLLDLAAELGSDVSFFLTGNVE